MCVSSSPPPICLCLCFLQACPQCLRRSIPSGMMLSLCLAGRRWIFLKLQICRQFLLPAFCHLIRTSRIFVQETKCPTSYIVCLERRKGNGDIATCSCEMEREKKRKGEPSDCCFSSTRRRQEAPSLCFEIEPSSLSTLETISKKPLIDSDSTHHARWNASQTLMTRWPH